MPSSWRRVHCPHSSNCSRHRNHHLLLQGGGAETFSFPPLTVQKNQCEFASRLNWLPMRLPFSRKHIRLLLEPLELDPGRGGPGGALPAHHSTFLRATVSSVTSESANRSTSCSTRSSRSLSSGYGWLLCQRRCSLCPLPMNVSPDMQTPYLCTHWRLPACDISVTLRGPLYSRAVRRSGAPPHVNTLAMESHQILPWVFLLPLHLSLCPNEHGSATCK